MRKDVLILGDCLVELKKLGENTIDCVVTDPPYELGFMGKAWDNTGIAYKVALWQEVLRVLKPGGHLLAFGGSRTYHRMACAIEDAGFEIRDQIMWVYGCLSEDTEILTINGWERYHKTIDNNLVLCYNVDNNSYEFHKPKRSFIYENKHTAYRIHSDSTDQIVSRNHRVLVERGGKLIFQRAEELQPQENIPFLESLPDLSEAISDYNKRTSNQEQGLSELYQGENGEMEQREIQNTGNYLQGLWQKFQAKMEQNKNDKVLLSTMQWKDKGNKPNRLQVRQNRNEISGNGIEWRQKSCLEGRSNLFQEARELFANKICQMSERILGYGSQGRLCYGTQAHNGSISQAVFTENRGCSPHQPQSAGQSGRKSAAIYNEQRSQNPRRTRAEVTPIEYKGNVWCVEVETGAFVARRNGKIFITGNSGFPKSLSIGKAVDKLQGNERTKGELKFKGGTQLGVINDDSWKPKDVYSDKGHSDWEGYGTALKPAHEPIVWATKRLTNTMEYDILSMDRNLKENIWLSIERLQRLDISKLQATVSIHLNTVLLWHAILGELSQSENKSTTSTVSKAITELKILNSLLLRNTQESTDGKSPTSLNGIQECQADGSKLLVKVVDKILGEEKKSMPDILTLIAQELATYRQSKNGISVESAVSDLLPIILNVNSVLLRVLTDLLTERNNSELSIFVSIAEKCLKQYLAEPLNTATQDVWLSHINTLVNHKPIVLARKPLSEKTVAENCLKWGVGGLNIDGCRVGGIMNQSGIRKETLGKMILLSIIRLAGLIQKIPLWQVPILLVASPPTLSTMALMRWWSCFRIRIQVKPQIVAYSIVADTVDLPTSVATLKTGQTRLEDILTTVAQPPASSIVLKPLNENGIWGVRGWKPRRCLTQPL